MQFYCFLRPSSELRFIQVADVDLVKKLIRVESKIAKNGKTEYVKIPDALVPYLEDLDLDSYPDNYFLIGLDGVPALKKVSYNYWSYHFREVRAALNMPDKYVFYSFKHSGAANYMDNTGDIVGLQRQMRHYSADVTSIYLRSIGIEDLTKLKTGFSVL
jgi:integrase